MNTNGTYVHVSREFLLSKDFIEIHKLEFMAGTSQVSHAAFKLDCYGMKAYLA